MRILIVEDSPTMALFVDGLVQPIRDMWPDAVLEKVGTFDDAVKIAKSCPKAPDVICLDPTLPDSSKEETFRRLHLLNGNSELIIITSSVPSELPPLHHPSIQILEKKNLTRGVLLGAIITALSNKRTREWEDITGKIDRMKEIANASA